MKVLICGDRNWTDVHSIAQEIMKLSISTVIIEGEAKGADTIAAVIGAYLGYEIERYPADWNKYQRAAGPIRNKQMLTEGKPDLVLAFHSDLEKSKGTKSMVMLAMTAGIETRVIKE